MSGTPDLLTHLGGVPVASASRYAGWWGANHRFVDFDNGTAGSAGNDGMESPAKYVDIALADAVAWDVIYIRPRTPDVAGGDPQGITPSSTTNLSIPNTKYGISLIGTGLGILPSQAAYQTRIQGDGTTTTTSPLTVLAPYVAIENLSFKRGASTGVPLVDLSSVSGAYAFACSIDRCQFHMGNGTAAASAAVLIASHWYAAITNNHFERCGCGIGLTSILSNPAGVSIVGNTFNQVTASNYGDIVSGATACNRIKISDNIFEQADPTVGTTVYIYMAGSANTGIVSNNYFGTATLVTATIMTLGGLLEAGSKCAKGFLTS